MPRRSFAEPGERAPPWVGDPKCTPPPFHGWSRPPAGASRWRACRRHRLTRKRRLPTRKARWQPCKRRRQPCRRCLPAGKPRLPTGKRRLQVRKTPKNGLFSHKMPVCSLFGPSPPSGTGKPPNSAPSRTPPTHSTAQTPSGAPSPSWILRRFLERIVQGRDASSGPLLAFKPVMKHAVKLLEWKDGTRHNGPVPSPFKMLPTGAQIEAYRARGYLVASARFDARREQFERFCAVDATPLVIIWPFASRRRRVTMQLFNCTVSIPDEEFRAAVRNLAGIWGASTHQAQRLPVAVADVTPRHARVLAGYLHQLAIEAYKRRAARVRNFLVIDGPASDGKPKRYGASCVFPVKGQRDYTCILELDNGERFQGGFISTREPQIEFIWEQFASRPGTFRLLTAPAKSP